MMTDDSQPVSTEVLLKLIAHPRRRQILHHLIEQGDGAVEIEALTKPISADGGVTTIQQHADQGRTTTELHHSHLPKLAERGLIEYDQQAGVIEYRSNDRVEDLLEFISTRLE